MAPTLKVGPKLGAFMKFALRAGTSVLLEGPTGVGKTELVRELARELGLPCKILNLSTLEPCDLTGMPQIANGKTTYAPPELLPWEASVLFFDEISRVRADMINPTLQLITLRELNSYKLPPGTLILAACNPEGEGYNTEALDLALQSRFARVRVEACPLGWAEWARRNQVHAAVLDFVLNTPSVFDGKLSNPRAWTYISSFLNTHAQTKDAQAFVQTYVQSFVGADLARAFMKVYRDPGTCTPPKVEEVLKGYAKVRARVQSITKSGDTALLNSLCSQVMARLQDPDEEVIARGSSRIKANLRAFRSDLPAEYRLKLTRQFPWLDKSET